MHIEAVWGLIFLNESKHVVGMRMNKRVRWRTDVKAVDRYCWAVATYWARLEAFGVSNISVG